MKKEEKCNKDVEEKDDEDDSEISDLHFAAMDETKRNYSEIERI